MLRLLVLAALSVPSVPSAPIRVLRPPALRRPSVAMCCGEAFLPSRKYQWETVHSAVAASVVRQYFHAEMDEAQACEVFTIEGVPAAAMLYTAVSDGSPIVDAFLLNKGMLLVFDGGTAMRKLFYDRHRRPSLRNATNRNDFLLF